MDSRTPKSLQRPGRLNIVVENGKRVVRFDTPVFVRVPCVFADDRWEKDTNGVEFQQAKATKAFVLSLPPGVFIVSSVRGSAREPFIEEAVGPREERDSLWRRLRETRMAHRNLIVFRNEGAYRLMMDAWLASNPGR